jgi:hypothetical protein
MSPPRLLNACQACPRAGQLTAPPAILPCSGHWVLAFPDAERAASAQQRVEECVHRMRAIYCQLLHPLLAAPGEDATGAAGGGRGEEAAASRA